MHFDYPNVVSSVRAQRGCITGLALRIIPCFAQFPPCQSARSWTDYAPLPLRHPFRCSIRSLVTVCIGVMIWNAIQVLEAALAVGNQLPTLPSLGRKSRCSAASRKSADIPLSLNDAMRVVCREGFVIVVVVFADTKQTFVNAFDRAPKLSVLRLLIDVFRLSGSKTL